jgi:hypothetical protein
MVARLKRLDAAANAMDYTRGFMTKRHGSFDDEGADAAVCPIVNLP